MFRDEKLTRPKKQSIIFTLIASLAAYYSAEFFPLIGYFLAITSMLLIGFASDSVWPTIKKSENPFVFALFWGLIIGLILPSLIIKLMDEGFAGIIDMITS